MFELEDFPTRVFVRNRRRYYYCLRFPDDTYSWVMGAGIVAPIEVKKEDEYYGDVQYSLSIPKSNVDFTELVGRTVFCRYVETTSETGKHYTIFHCDEYKAYVLKQYIISKDVFPFVPADTPHAGVVSRHDGIYEMCVLKPTDVDIPVVSVATGDADYETIQGHLEFTPCDVEFEMPLSWRHHRLMIYNHVITGDFSAVRFRATINGDEYTFVAVKPWRPLTIKSVDHETVKFFRKTGVFYHPRPVSGDVVD